MGEQGNRSNKVYRFFASPAWQGVAGVISVAALLVSVVLVFVVRAIDEHAKERERAYFQVSYAWNAEKEILQVSARNIGPAVEPTMHFEFRQDYPCWSAELVADAELADGRLREPRTTRKSLPMTLLAGDIEQVVPNDRVIIHASLVSTSMTSECADALEYRDDDSDGVAESFWLLGGRRSIGAKTSQVSTTTTTTTTRPPDGFGGGTSSSWAAYVPVLSVTGSKTIDLDHDRQNGGGI